MRTISAKYPKGQEPPRRFSDTLRLWRYMVSALLNYLILGHAIRKRWYAKQSAREKYYVDEE